ncbi:MAG: anti-sigma factor family protein [Candidatus Acidiferrum sp.]
METFGKQPMNCEQVEAIVFDLERDDLLDPLERAAAVAHVGHCPRCAALQESWQAAREELRTLAEENVEAVAPARVEMRLRQEFRTRHRTHAARRGAVVAAWALAAAAVIAGAVSWHNWQHSLRSDVAKQTSPAVSDLPSTGVAAAQIETADNSSAAASSSDDLGGFTALPGTLPDLT